MLSIGLGGALGSICRFGVSHFLNNAFPWGTFVVNVIGSWILGALFAASKGNVIASDSLLFAFLAIGFCGAFTTFSTFSLEIFKLWSTGNTTAAIIHVIANFICSISAVIFGHWIISHLVRHA